MAKATRDVPGDAMPVTPRATISGAISSDERRRMIAEAAYSLVEQRVFSGGGHERDWLEAETLVSQRLTSFKR